MLLFGARVYLQRAAHYSYLALPKAESTLQQDIKSDAGWYQEERSPKAKTPIATLLLRWLLVPLLSFAFLDKLVFYPLTVAVPSTRWPSHSKREISQPCSPTPF